MSAQKKQQKQSGSAAAWARGGAFMGIVVGVFYSLYDTIICDNGMFGHVIPAIIGALFFGWVGLAIGLACFATLGGKRKKKTDSDVN